MLKRKLCIISLLFVCYLSAYGQQVTGAEAAKAAVTIMHIADCSSAATLMSDYSVNGVFEDLPADTLSSPKSLLQSASFADDATLKVYPNPTNDLLHIELAGGAGIASAALYDLQGRTVRTRFIAPASSQTATVDMRNVPAGVYMLRVRDAEGKVVKR